MIERIYLITCDWCGREEHVHQARMDAALKTYAACCCLYEYTPISPISDELFLKSQPYVFSQLEFCCEECADKWFEENPDCRSHYKLKKVKK